MKMKLKTIASSTLVLAAVNQVYGQYTPPPPPAPFPGFINEALRKNDPYMNKWDFGGSIRARYETKDGYGMPGVGVGGAPAVNTASLDFRAHNADVKNDYFMEKIRFRAGYTDKWWSVLAEGESSLVQGDERWAYANTANTAVAPGTVKLKGQGPEADSIELHQAAVTIGNHKQFPLSLKLGRMEMSYGDERLIGALAWNNIGRTFDAAKLRWQNEWFAADMFCSHPVVPENGVFDQPNVYDYFSGIYATSTKVPKNTLDVYFLARNASAQALAAVPSPQFPQPSQRDIYTIGLRLKSKPGEFGNWDYGLEGAYQFGDFLDKRAGAPTALLNQSAYMAILQGGYTFANAWGTPRIGLEYDYSSGDSNPHDGTHGTFDNLFPTNHKFYGYMDFLSLQNMQDVRASITLKPTSRMSVALEGHGFWLANTQDSFYNVGGGARGGTAATPAGNGYGVNPGYSSYLGSEVDFIAGYALTRFAQLEAGYGHFFTGQYIQQSLSNPFFGSKDANFFYLQITSNF